MRTQYYQDQLSVGQSFEAYVGDRLRPHGFVLASLGHQEQVTVGENRFGLEIKRDGNYRLTGNLFIETAEKSDSSNPAWIDSGILRNDQCWLYGIGDEQTFWIFDRKALRRLRPGRQLIEGKAHTNRGFLLPIVTADIYAATKFVAEGMEWTRLVDVEEPAPQGFPQVDLWGLEA